MFGWGFSRFSACTSRSVSTCSWLQMGSVHPMDAPGRANLLNLSFMHLIATSVPSVMWRHLITSEKVPSPIFASPL